MTLSANDRRTPPQAGDGATVDFDFDFPIDTEDELIVILTDSNGTETNQVLNSDYTVAFTPADENGGTITMGSAPDSSATITMGASTSKAQGTDLKNQDAYNEESIESRFDKAYKLIQENVEAIGRSVKSSLASGSTNLTDVNIETYIGEQISAKYVTEGGQAIPKNNISQLINISLASLINGQAVEVLGFYTPGDGGGGLFIWNATGDKSTHNGGTIIDPDIGVVPGAAGWWTASTGAGVWVKAKDLKIVNVLEFGAKGDNAYDDTSAIAAAIATGYNVFAIDPTVNYLISGTLGSLSQYQTFSGNGFIKVIVDNTVSDFTVLTLVGSNTVENIWFDGKVTTQGTCVKLSNGTGSSDMSAGNVLRNCWLRVFEKGMAVDNGFNNSFYNVQFRNCKYGVEIIPTAEAIGGDYIAAFDFYDCRFYANTENDIKQEASANSKFRGMNFYGCNFDPKPGAVDKPSMVLINASIVNWDGCYFETYDDATAKKILDATGSAYMMISNALINATNGFDLTSSVLYLDNVWSFADPSGANPTHDPIVAASNSQVYIKNSQLRSTAHNFRSGCTNYTIENSTLYLDAATTFFKFVRGGTNTNNFITWKDSSDSQVGYVDEDLLNHDNVKVNTKFEVSSYTDELSSNISGISGNGSGGKAIFTFTAVDPSRRPAIFKLRLMCRDSVNDGIAYNPACEYIFAVTTDSSNDCFISSVTANFENVFIYASHFTFTNLGSKAFKIELDNPIASALSGYYNVEIIGLPYTLVASSA